jgi:hypothetical protein
MERPGVMRGTISGADVCEGDTHLSLKVLKPSRPRIPDKWTYYRGDARLVCPLKSGPP